MAQLQPLSNNPNQPESEHMDHQFPYIPLYVSPLFSTAHPTPSLASTALYTLTVAPHYLLEVGMRVQLHFLYASTFVIPDAAHPEPDQMSIPLAIKGWIAGERSRTSREIEYVVKNEQPNAPIRRAFVRARIRPGTFPLQDLGGLIARRFPGHPIAPAAGADEEGRDGRGGPRRWDVRRETSSYSTAAAGRGRGELDARGRDEPVVLFPISPLPRTADMVRPQATAAPYNMWVTYGGNTAPYATQAENDAIRNYGCPIIVGPRERLEERDLPLPTDWQTPDPTRETWRSARSPGDWSGGARS